MEEVWKDIAEFPGTYQVSSLGQVRSVSRMCKVRGRGYRPLTGRILKQHVMPNGYLVVKPSSRKHRVNMCVHRLVAEAFVDRPDGTSCVNHIDGNKANNAAYNLQWVTSRENNIHAYMSRLKSSQGRYGLDGGLLGIREIRAIVDLSDKVSISDLAKAFRASNDDIERILTIVSRDRSLAA